MIMQRCGITILVLLLLQGCSVVPTAPLAQDSPRMNTTASDSTQATGTAGGGMFGSGT